MRRLEDGVGLQSSQSATSSSRIAWRRSGNVRTSKSWTASCTPGSELAGCFAHLPRQRVRREALGQRAGRDREREVADVRPLLDEPRHRAPAAELAVVSVGGEHEHALPASTIAPVVSGLGSHEPHSMVHVGPLKWRPFSGRSAPRLVLLARSGHAPRRVRAPRGRGGADLVALGGWRIESDDRPVQARRHSGRRRPGCRRGRRPRPVACAITPWCSRPRRSACRSMSTPMRASSSRWETAASSGGCCRSTASWGPRVWR